MNPLTRLKPALYAALTSPALVYQGSTVLVKRFLAGNTADNYVLLSQPTVVELPGSRGCRQWSCTHLLDVVTQFPTAAVSDIVTDGIAELVLQRVAGVALAMPPQWQTSPGRLELESELRETDQTLLLVRRLLRLRWTVSYSGADNAVAAVAAGESPGAVQTEYPFVNQTDFTIAHYFGRAVQATVYDMDRNEIDAQISYPDLNHVRIQFSQPLTGTVVLR